MSEFRNILVVGSGFSGSTGSLIHALRDAGCLVTHKPVSLRVLPLRPAYLAGMTFEALGTYGRRFRSLIRKTRVHNVAMTKAIAALVRSHAGTDLVIHIGNSCAAPGQNKVPGVTYVLYTDHTNLLSKKLPDFGIDLPERHVSDRWNDVERSIFNGQDHIFVMGGHVKRSLVDDYGVPSSRVTVVGAGPNIDVDVERDLGAKDFSGKNVLFVGIDGPRKGLDTLKLAFRRLHEVHADARLDVVGVAGLDEPGIKHHGKVFGEAMKQFFYDAQVLALPSLREPFGIALLEAMWSKTVCIGTNIEAIPEIVRDGETGYLIEPGDHGSLAARLIGLFDSPADLQRMAERAYLVARREWRWDSVARTILDCSSLADDVPVFDVTLELD